MGVVGRVAVGFRPARDVLAQGKHLVPAVVVGRADGQSGAAGRTEKVHQLIEGRVVAVAAADHGRSVGDQAAQGEEIVIVGQPIGEGQAGEVREGQLEVDALRRAVGDAENSSGASRRWRPRAWPPSATAGQNSVATKPVPDKGLHFAAIEIARKHVTLSGHFNEPQGTIGPRRHDFGGRDFVVQRRQLQPRTTAAKRDVQRGVFQHDARTVDAAGRLPRDRLARGRRM